MTVRGDGSRRASVGKADSDHVRRQNRSLVLSALRRCEPIARVAQRNGYRSSSAFAAAFRKTGIISLSAAGDSVKPPPAPKGAVRKFLSACK